MSLSIEEVNSLILKIRAGDLNSKDILVNENIPLVWSLVHRYKNTYYDKEGVICRIKARKRYTLAGEFLFVINNTKQMTICPNRWTGGENLSRRRRATYTLRYFWRRAYQSAIDGDSGRTGIWRNERMFGITRK